MADDDEPYKEEVSKLLDLAKFAILAMLVIGGFMGSEILL
tara:strand:+ start:159 stop:278 length:120 start_codon:yes stop_codon:yes gene_type:complete